MLVVGFDLETEWTTPVDPIKARIWEYACVLWDTNTNEPVAFASDLVWQDNYIFDSRMKIEKHHLEEFALPPLIALERIRKFFENSEYIVAHNGKDFDKIVIEEEFKRHGFDPPKKTWLDTTVDILYPPSVETRKLEFLGPVHGFLNPYSHRALFDVCSMLKVASKYDWNVTINRAKTPDIYIVADVDKPWQDGGRSTDAAKARGYRFDKESKYWVKKIKENELPDEKAGASFRVGIWKKETRK
jgi:DNA polymerase-3 subunit epsilon